MGEAVCSIQNMTFTPGKLWCLATSVNGVKLDFLVDPGAVISAISHKCFLGIQKQTGICMESDTFAMKLEVANKSQLRVYGQCKLPLRIANLDIVIVVLVCDLKVPALLGTDVI